MMSAYAFLFPSLASGWFDDRVSLGALRSDDFVPMTSYLVLSILRNT